MSKKNTQVPVVSIKDEVYGFTVCRFDYVKNVFICNCGGHMRWTGGRFSSNGNAGTMETITCQTCGKSVDPRLVFGAALKHLAAWEARQEDYRRKAVREAHDREVDKAITEAQAEYDRLVHVHADIRRRRSFAGRLDAVFAQAGW